MKILALEFSTLRRSAAILEISGGNARVLDSIAQEAQRGGSPFPLLDALFKKIERDEIEGIAVGLGPGSYTGIRSSLAIAQGWNLSRNIPAAGVSSADAIAFEAWSNGRRDEIEVVIDAQRGEVYSATYQLTEATFVTSRPLEILSKPGTLALVGPEAKRWSVEGVEIFPSAAFIGQLAAQMSFVSPERLDPIYLREPSFVKAPAVPLH